jgi:predicted phosphodiesterase
VLVPLFLLLAPVAGIHDGPDPVMSWRFRESELRGNYLAARLGPDPRVLGKLQATAGPSGGSLMFDGVDDRMVVADDISEINPFLPKKHFTISAWLSVNTPQAYGGIFSAIQDNGGFEKGWVLGYSEKHFYIGLASLGANDGDGSMTYLSGTSIYEVGKMYHVTATYDGKELCLYVNGVLENKSEEQSGAILYPKSAPVVLGGYKDDNEDVLHHGRIREVTIYNQTASPKWVRQDFEHNADLALNEPLIPLDPNFTMLVKPFLQYGTSHSMTVTWETSRPASSELHWNSKVSGKEETYFLENTLRGNEKTLIHSIVLDGLSPGTGYFYQVESEDSEGRILKSPILTFQSAVEKNIPFAFAVISDTQDNPPVASKISRMAWEMRPHFVLHPGDLVGTGTNKLDWLNEFFPSMDPLLSRVPIYPVLGNHEQDARHYYDYMNLPAPEYYYDFHYGNTHFFMLDTNRKVHPGSEQYNWLEQGLEASTATWKIVTHHHPPFTSDENDYGNMWLGPSTHGDMRVRELTELYDRYEVDIVWNGHIHSYERTWPIHQGKVVEKNGTIYMITGGGGGGLETPGPIRPWFQNNVRRGHHWCYVAVNGGTLELKAFDLEGRMFDVLTLTKSIKRD